MKRAELAHVLRAASDITRAVEFLVVGSAAGWEQRLVRFSPPDANGVVGYCLEPHDCVAAKLGAGREKDYEFAEALLNEKLVRQSTLLERVRSLPRNTGLLLSDIRRAERWVEAYGKPLGPKPTTVYAQVSFTSRPGTVAKRSHARARGEQATLCGRLGGRAGTYALTDPPREIGTSLCETCRRSFGARRAAGVA